MALTLLQRIDYRAGTTLPLARRRASFPRGVLSVTFDDFPRTAWTEGGAMVAEAGGRATFFLAGRFLGASVDGVPHAGEADVADLVAAGHELGCHSFDHRSALESTVPEYLDSVRRNAARVAAILPGHPLRSHAFPFGQVRVAARLALRPRFGTLRGIEAPRAPDRFDRTHLRAGGLEDRREGTLDWPGLIAATARARGWLVLFTHGVTDRPTPFDTRPAALARVLAAARAEGLELLPVAEAMARLGGADAPPAPQTP